MFREKIQGKNFDSRLLAESIWASDMTGDVPTPFRLIIDLRIYLHPLNPPGTKTTFQVKDTDQNSKTCSRWTDGDWALFTDTYGRQVQEFWDALYVLTPPASYKGLIYPLTGPAKKRRKVQCHFNLILSPTSRNRVHADIPVVHLNNPGDTFRSHSFLYSNKDIEPEDRSHTGMGWQSLTDKHEVGHLLGLDHANETSRQCRQHPGSEICYASTMKQKLDVMGTGGQAWIAHAEPWRLRVARHTSTNARDWKVDWVSLTDSRRGINY